MRTSENSVHTNFRELSACEVRRLPLLSTSVDKASQRPDLLCMLLVQMVHVPVVT
jgi:hypothetical protein